MLGQIIKKAQIAFLFLFSFYSIEAFSNPFSGRSIQSVAEDTCQFQEVYSSYKAEYIWFNILKKLFDESSLLDDHGEHFTDHLSEAMESVVASCGQSGQRYYDLGSLNGVQVQNNELEFELFQKRHRIRKIEDEVSTTFIYQQYVESLDLFVTFMHSRGQLGSYLSHRILGRQGSEGSINNYYFLYSPQGEMVSRSTSVSLSVDQSDFKPLSSIYGEGVSDALVQNPQVVVGVIGSGVDYNHPMIARHLVGREIFDDEVAYIEELKDKTLTHDYSRFSELNNDLQLLEQKKNETGFPIWMDQALASKRPMDKIIPVIQGRSSNHETMMAGRIVLNQGNVGLVSVRKAYLNMAQENLIEVFGQFNRLGVKVVNLSYAYNCASGDSFEEQWRQVFESYPDMIVVAAAGNDGMNTDETAYCPAKYSREYDQVVSVTAIGTENLLASYNGLSVNYGETITVAARADSLQTLLPLGVSPSLMENGGSSMAAAETSRILVEALEKGLPLTGGNVKEHLQLGSIANGSLAGQVSFPGVLDQTQFEISLNNLLTN